MLQIPTCIAPFSYALLQISPMENPNENKEKVNFDNVTCYSCGKVFKKPSELLKHKNRKTPCLIRDIKPEDLKNPLRCIYCNKIFSKLSNLTKHHPICKIKNGGLDKLHGKVKYEETLRIRDEEHNLEIMAIKAEMLAMKTEMMEEMNKLKSSVAVSPTTVNNNTINKGVINNNINIHINNYTTPSVDHLLTFEKFNSLFMKEFAGLPIAIVCNLYFDSSHPENMSLHLINKSTGEMLAMMDDGWKTMSIEDVAMKIRDIGYNVTERGIKMHRKDIKFVDANWVCDNIIQNVHHPKTTERDIKEIKEKIVESREVTGAAPHIASKLESSRAVGRVRRGLNGNLSNVEISDLRGDIIAE